MCVLTVDNIRLEFTNALAAVGQHEDRLDEFNRVYQQFCTSIRDQSWETQSPGIETARVNDHIVLTRIRFGFNINHRTDGQTSHLSTRLNELINQIRQLIPHGWKLEFNVFAVNKIAESEIECLVKGIIKRRSFQYPAS